MNLVLLFPEDFISASGISPGQVELRGRRLEHIRDVHRVAVGDRLCVGLVNDRVGTGLILELDRDRIRLQVVLERDPPAPLPVTLVLAMPRPLVLRRVLSGTTTMGVKRIVLLNANRVERSFWNSRVLRDGELEKPLVLGLEQARDTRIPAVEIRTRFKPFVADELPKIIDGTRAYVAHPESERACPRAVEGPVTLVVGPEGGFIPYEMECLVACGCIPVHLGERILRVETVIPALLSRLF